MQQDTNFVSMRAVLMSIKPKYAKKIISGSKTVELRRVAPKVNSPTIILIYESTPIKAITSYAILNSITIENPPKLWEMFSDEVQISKDEFDIYYMGAEKAYALHISDAKTLSKPIKLEELRSQNFLAHPPQSYRYISLEEVFKIFDIKITLSH